MKKLLIILIILSYGTLLSAESNWIKSDSIWTMKSEISKVLSSHTLDDNYFTTYSTDSIFRIWNIDDGKVIDSLKLEKVAENIVYSYDGNYFVATRMDKVVDRPNQFTFNFELYDTKTLTKIGESIIKDTVFTKNILNGSQFGAFTGVALSEFLFDIQQNELILFFNIGLIGGNGPQELTFSGGFAIEMTISNNNLAIISFKKISQVDRIKLFNNSFYTLNSQSSYNGPASSNYSSSYSLSTTLNKFQIDSLKFENIFSYTYSSYQQNSGSQGSENFYYVMLDFFFTKYGLYFWGDYGANQSFSKYDFNTKQNIHIKEIKNYQPFFFTNNDQYLVCYKKNYPGNNDIIFYNLNSQKDELNISAIPKSDYNTLLLNTSGDKIVHIINLENSSQVKVYDLNYYLKKVDFSISKQKIQKGESVVLESYSNFEPKEVLWTINGIIYNDNPEHKFTFREIGTYSISLTITDENDKTYSITKENILEVQDSVIANFESFNNSGKAPLEVKFKNLSRGKDLIYYWDFGDKQSSTEKDPIHIYQDSGSYSVRLIIENELKKDTILKYFEVNVNTIKPINANIIKRSVLKFDGIKPAIKEEGTNLSLKSLFTTDNRYLLSMAYNISGLKIGSYTLYYIMDIDNLLNLKTTSKTESVITSSLNDTKKVDSIFIAMNNTNIYEVNSVKGKFSKLGPTSSYATNIISHSDKYLVGSSGNLIIYNKDFKTDTTLKFPYSFHYIKDMTDSIQILAFDAKKNFYILNLNDNYEITSSIKNDSIGFNTYHFTYNNNDFYFLHNYNGKTIVAKFDSKEQKFINKELTNLNSVNDFIIWGDKLIVLCNFKLFTGFIILDENLNIYNEVREFGENIGYVTGLINDDNNLVVVASIPSGNMKYLDQSNWINKLIIQEISLKDIPKIVSVEESKVNISRGGFLVYPNPATDYITINLDRCATLQKCGTSEIEIYDVMGMKIQTTPVETIQELSPQRIDISNLAPGVYFVKMVGSNGACSIVVKFVKM